VTPETTSRNCSTVRVERGADPRKTAIRRCIRSLVRVRGNDVGGRG